MRAWRAARCHLPPAIASRTTCARLNARSDRTTSSSTVASPSGPESGTRQPGYSSLVASGPCQPVLVGRSPLRRGPHVVAERPQTDARTVSQPATWPRLSRRAGGQKTRRLSGQLLDTGVSRGGVRRAVHDRAGTDETVPTAAGGPSARIPASSKTMGRRCLLRTERGALRCPVLTAQRPAYPRCLGGDRRHAPVPAHYRLGRA